MTKTFLGYKADRLKTMGGYHTAREITGQPRLWMDTWEKLCTEKEDISNFLDYVLALPDLEVVLTGAGTSAYIGDAAEPFFRKYCSGSVRAIPTTTLVTHFHQYINPAKPLLLISYARSGNSPESTAVLEMAEAEMRADLFHLVITCNADGALAKKAAGTRTYSFLLPPEAEDQGLAMTGSFSSMLLASLLIARLDKLNGKEDEIQLLVKSGEHLIRNEVDMLRLIADKKFKRAVFLGSGPMLGIAKESHLKLQELTDGKVICKYDSFLGFRHGPEAVIDDETLLVYLMSEDPYVRCYEQDLVSHIASKNFGMASLGICGNSSEDLETDFLIDFKMNEKKNFDQVFSPVLYVVPAQILAFFKSLQAGLEPDEPSAKGAITRVVEGVTIYPRPSCPEKKPKKEERGIA